LDYGCEGWRCFFVRPSCDNSQPRISYRLIILLWVELKACE
jgi:hypothetical protein